MTEARAFIFHMCNTFVYWNKFLGVEQKKNFGAIGILVNEIERESEKD